MISFQKEGEFIDPKSSSDPVSVDNFQKKFFTNLKQRETASNDEDFNFRVNTDDDVRHEIVEEWFLDSYTQTNSAEDLIDKNEIVQDFFEHFEMDFEGEILKRKRHKLMTGVNKCINNNRHKYGKVQTKVRVHTRC